MMKKGLLFIVLLVLAMTACTSAVTEEQTADSIEDSPSIPKPTANSGGMGMGGSMRDRHHAPIPEAYIDLTNPVAADEESLARGGEIYMERCASCHGDEAMGDGPAAASLDPGPVPIARTSQMMGDDYLFYRISEGGLMDPFNSTMPAWKDILDERARWDVLNYVRAVGSGQVPPGRGNGAAVNAESEAAKHAEMIAAGVAQALFSQADGDVFLAVHDEIDLLQDGGMEATGGGPDEMLPLMLTELVDNGRITQEEADTFRIVHDTLDEAGLMQ